LGQRHPQGDRSSSDRADPRDPNPSEAGASRSRPPRNPKPVASRGSARRTSWSARSARDTPCWTCWPRPACRPRSWR